MPEPIVEQIAVAIEARLLTITTANGYQVSVAGVLRPAQLGINAVSARHLMVAMAQLDARLDELKTHPLDATPDGRPLIDWIQPWSIACFIQTSENATDAADTLLNRLRSSVEKALLVDPGWGPAPTTPLAYETRLVGADLFKITLGGFVGASVILEVGYTTLESDPYTQPTI